MSDSTDARFSLVNTQFIMRTQIELLKVATQQQRTSTYTLVTRFDVRDVDMLGKGIFFHPQQARNWAKSCKKATAASPTTL